MYGMQPPWYPTFNLDLTKTKLKCLIFFLGINEFPHHFYPLTYETEDKNNDFYTQIWSKVTPDNYIFGIGLKPDFGQLLNPGSGNPLDTMHLLYEGCVKHITKAILIG